MNYVKGILASLVLLGCQTTQAIQQDSIQIIVKFKSTFPLNSVKQLKHLYHLPINHMESIADGIYTLTFDVNALQQQSRNVSDATYFILQQLKKDPRILYAVKDRVGYFKPLPRPNSFIKKPRLSHEAQWDEFSPPGGIMLKKSYNDQTGGAWEYTSGRSFPPVVVAVLDTGIAAHESLENNLLKDTSQHIFGWNFAANNDDLSDETNSFHGTHVAGTIAAYGKTMVGIGDNFLKILTVKIPDESGMFYESSVIKAIRWSVGGHVDGVPDNPFPAKVLNMSFGVDERPGKEIDHCDEALQEAIKFARDKGAVLVAAAGNDDRWEHYNAPAVCNGTIKVAATGPKGLRAYYSNYGPSVTLAAPGGDLSSGNPEHGILSTVQPGGGYNYSGFDFYQGTSMASPHVAGVAGLIFAVSEVPLHPQRVEQILYTTTHAFGASDNVNNSCLGEKPCGHGILNARNALDAISARFDVYFSAPTLNRHNEDNQYHQPEPSASWIPIGSMSRLSSIINVPYVFKQQDGQIYAQSGRTMYRLNQMAYQYCQIIGFDGVGCHH